MFNNKHEAESKDLYYMFVLCSVLDAQLEQVAIRDQAVAGPGSSRTRLQQD